jgi:hypothetical protein
MWERGGRRLARCARRVVADAVNHQPEQLGDAGRDDEPDGGSGDDAVHLEALRELAVHVHAVDAREVPHVLRIGVAPVLL